MNPQAEESELFDRGFDELREMRAQEAVSDWNRKHGVGTEVAVQRDDGTLWLTKTRSPAWALDSGHLMVMLEGRSGGYSLERVRAVVS